MTLSTQQRRLAAGLVVALVGVGVRRTVSGEFSLRLPVRVAFDRHADAATPPQCLISMASEGVHVPGR